jgi:uncharacterized membrane protein YeaQ/YmgE (transglycosylase-associated protein family)
VGVIAWIVVGLLAGWLAHMILGDRGGIFHNLAVGLIGAIVGGFLFSKLDVAIAQGFLGSLLTATIGAIICLLVWRALRRA